YDSDGRAAHLTGFTWARGGSVPICHGIQPDVGRVRFPLRRADRGGDQQESWETRVSSSRTLLRYLRLCQLLTPNLLLLTSQQVGAACNAVPPAVRLSYRATKTTLDRPFASPGDPVTLAIDPICSGVGRTFAMNPADQVVTVVFTPPLGAPNVVVLAASCVGIASCPGVTTNCIETNPIDVE